MTERDAQPDDAPGEAGNDPAHTRDLDADGVPGWVRRQREAAELMAPPDDDA
jgi:hypothetical protein